MIHGHAKTEVLRLCAECGVISLGFYLKSYAAYGANIARLAVYPWFSSRHNMGMALDRATWDRIRNCSKVIHFKTTPQYMFQMDYLIECRKALLAMFTPRPEE